MSRNWLAVAAADHVAIGRGAGFMQVCHGKAAPLQRIQPGDRIVYYSPNSRYSPSHAVREKDRLQSFTAIGTVKAGNPYRVDTDALFRPFRRDVHWHEACPTALALLREDLEFAREKNWGYRLRSGLIEISDRDMAKIAEAMFTGAAPPCRQAA